MTDFWLLVIAINIVVWAPMIHGRLGEIACAIRGGKDEEE